MKLKSTLLCLLFLSSLISFGQSTTLTTLVPDSTFCTGEMIEVSFVTSDTFVYDNIFTIELSNAAGSFTSSTVLDTINNQSGGNYFVAAPLVTAGSAYRIRVSASNPGYIDTAFTNIRISGIPVVTFNLQPNSFCLLAPAFTLTGGLPAGGFYSDSNNYVSANVFDPDLSGLGTHTVYYTYSDSLGCGNTASDQVEIVNCPIPSIITQVSPTSFCPGQTMTIGYITSDPFFSDNIFTIQLSNAAGSFASPTVLDTIQAQTGDTVTYPAPAVTPGSGYKIRVIASSPPVNGIPLGSFTIRQQFAAPNVQLTALGDVDFCLGDSVRLQLDSLSFLSTKWFRNGIAFNTGNRFNALVKDSGLYVVTFTDTAVAGCSSGADTLLVAVHTFPPKPVVTASGALNICGSGTVTLTAPQNASYTYSWTNYGTAITGETTRTYTADSTGQYRAIVARFGCPTASDLIRVNINPQPIVTFTLALDSFCLNSPPVNLSGGLPSGGIYSGVGVTSGSTFTQSGLGVYTITYTYTDSIGCSGSNTDQLEVFDCTTTSTGINNLTAENLFSMYPNPTKDVVTFVTDKSAYCSLRILTLIGEEVTGNSFHQQMSYSTKDLAPGVYIAEITDLASGAKSVKRLVKE
ncbi:MAG: T9SS type A sorting domain-containing protein [Bacteroidota bacterium]